MAKPSLQFGLGIEKMKIMSLGLKTKYHHEMQDFTSKQPHLPSLKTLFFKKRFLKEIRSYD